MEKELTTVYLRKDTTFSVKRSVLNTDKTYSIFSYKIAKKTWEVSEQKFINKEDFKEKADFEKVKNGLIAYNWQPVKSDTTVLFVQVSGKAFANAFEALEKKGEYETKIGDLLQERKQGEWFAGDTGPGGANMLFISTNPDEAIKTIVEVLTNERLEAKTAIARRVRKEDGDWFYEVLYPHDFSGYFITQ